MGIREALRQDISGVSFENPFTELKKGMAGPYVIRAILRDEELCGKKGAAVVRAGGLVPGVVSGLFGDGVETPVAVDGDHLTRLHQQLGYGISAVPMRLSFQGVDVPGFEGRAFAPQVVAHQLQRRPVSRRSANDVVPWAVRFRFAPAGRPVATSVPVVVVGEEENEGTRKGRSWDFLARAVNVVADRPDLLPRQVTIDVKDDDEQGIHRLRDVAALLPEGVRLHGYRDLEQPVVRVAWRTKFGIKPDYSEFQR